MLQQDKGSPPIKIVVTNHATFSHVARTQIRSETALLTAHRKRDDRQQALVSTKLPFTPLQPVPHLQATAAAVPLKLVSEDPERSQSTEHHLIAIENLPKGRARLRNSTIKSNKQSSYSLSYECALGHNATWSLPRSLVKSFEGSTSQMDAGTISLLHAWRDRRLSHWSWMSSRSLVDWVVPRALHDEGLFNSLLCSAITPMPDWPGDLRTKSAAKDAGETLHPARSNRRLLVLYKTRAIHFLRQHILHDVNNDDSVTVIAYTAQQLLACELTYGTVRGVCAHIDGLHCILQSTNVLQVAPLSVLISITTVILLGAAITETLPLFPPIVPQVVLSFDTWTALSNATERGSSKTATGFCGWSVTSLVGSVLTNLIQRRRQWFCLSRSYNHGSVP